jgi:hypothetical protein
MKLRNVFCCLGFHSWSRWVRYVHTEKVFDILGNWRNTVEDRKWRICVSCPKKQDVEV